MLTFFFPDKDDKKRFFEKTFLLANASLYIVLRISFFTINNIYVNF